MFFDVGGTLLRPWPSVGAIYSRVGRRHGIVADDEAMERAFHNSWAEMQAQSGPLTIAQKDWWRQLVFHTIDTLELDGEGSQREAYFEELYDVFTRAEAWRVYPEVPEVLRIVRARGLHVGVISDWDCRLRPLLEAVGLTDWDSVTVSCEVGSEKPDPAIFRAALAAANVEPAEALHIGDSLEADVRGAEAVGMRAVLIDRAGNDQRGCPVIRDLREIIPAT